MAEKEYIERSALLDDLDAAMKNSGMGYGVGQTMKRYIKRVPAADVAPVVHARWVDRRKEDCCEGEEPLIVGMKDGCPTESCYCSECENWLGGSDEYYVIGNYCPNCGALMDGGKHG